MAIPARQAWYRQQAEHLTILYTWRYMDSAIVGLDDGGLAYTYARMSAHFGRLALAEAEADLRRWTRLGATKQQAVRLNAIPYRDTSEAEFTVAIRDNRVTNMWPCAISWLDAGAAVFDNGEMFIRDVERAAPAAEGED